MRMRPANIERAEEAQGGLFHCSTPRQIGLAAADVTIIGRDEWATEPDVDSR